VVASIWAVKVVTAITLGDSGGDGEAGGERTRSGRYVFNAST
jgi:hypothetical protein